MTPSEPRRRRTLVPEVIQTSSMDCGPAALSAVLTGFGVAVSYGTLRETCQTSLDGTSIDTLEEVAPELGLRAEQTLLPLEHVLLGESDTLPAIMVVARPNGGTHFVVVWRRHGELLQVMDPAAGRRWVRRAELERELYVHEMFVPGTAFRAWAGGAPFRAGLERRARRVGIGRRHIGELLDTALRDGSARGVARLDAALRMLTALVAAGALRRGGEACRALRAVATPDGARDAEIPESYWAASTPADATGDDVLLRGAVLVKFERDDCLPPTGEPVVNEAAAGRLRQAVVQAPPRPLVALGRLLLTDGILSPVVLGVALVCAAAAVVAEAVLLRSLLGAAQRLAPSLERSVSLLSVVAFLALVALTEVPLGAGFARLGRRLDVRLRAAYLAKLPQLSDRYFASRLASDMAERGHALHLIRRLPELAARLVRALSTLACCTLGVAWLAPESALLAVALAFVAVSIPLAVQPLLGERDLRARTHQGALTRFYLDALLGLMPLRAHNAARTILGEHEALLVDWIKASHGVRRAQLWVDAAVAVPALALATWLLFRHLQRPAAGGSLLLLVYWTLQLPLIGEEVAGCLRAYPALRSVMLRLLELMGSPEAIPPTAPSEGASADPAEPASEAPSGVEIVFDGVSARAGGHDVLEGVALRVGAGEHVAVIGASGAGKSSLMGLLLGWLTPERGEIRVDGLPLDGPTLSSLRAASAWLDPSVQLHNRPLLDNLLYGAPAGALQRVPHVLSTSELRSVLAHLPSGLQTELGDGGALLSGGEGQRVRLGRAVARERARLAILDEPFRGLDREQRRALLGRVRALWRHATLFFVTHDIAETTGFGRVLVLEHGRVVEDGAPSELLEMPGSRYVALLAAEQRVAGTLWEEVGFRRLRLEQGLLRETPGGAAP
ncbi:MAG TPA: cysteine peptidase family C39 domain-containing protein [Polyangiaceae bacterium]|nr:cysteine peptidase family C39 domain-containing protein [Polyangiaceae bacterium]